MTAPQPPDLGALERKPTLPPPPPRRWSALALPAAIVAAFLAILAWSMGDVFVDATEVTVLRPRQGDAATGATGAAGRVLFQAAGWVEPDPFPLEVAALTDGVVAELLVEESDVVAKGDVVARLVDADAALEHRAAVAAVAAADAARSKALVEADAARRDFDEAIDLTRRVEVAAATLAARRAETELARHAASRTESAVTTAKLDLEVERHLKEEGAAGPFQLEQARARLDAVIAARAEAEAQVERAAAAEREAAAVEKATARDAELRIEERRRVAAADRELSRATAALEEAQARRDLAALRLERVNVTSPWDGVVLERTSTPGATVGPGATPLFRLFDPARLRVRVDVPFGDVGATFVGQRVEVLCDARPGRPYAGTVSRRVQQADIQKVTLEVQVRIDDPDAALRPDMLAQARFLAPAQNEGARETGAATLLVPARLLVGGDRLWVIDPVERRAELREVEVGATRGDWTEVLSGIDLTTQLVDEGRRGLEDGARVTVTRGGSE